MILCTSWACNHAAKVCLDDILGGAADGLDGSRPCSWLPFLLGSELGHAENRVQTRVIRDYIFKIYTYDQRYSNGIVDRYHWITIARAEQPAAAGKNSEALPAGTGQPLTKAELRVARLLAKGLTYQAVADKLVVELPHREETCAEYLPQVRGELPVPALPLDGAERSEKVTPETEKNISRKMLGGAPETADLPGIFCAVKIGNVPYIKSACCPLFLRGGIC